MAFALSIVACSSREEARRATPGGAVLRDSATGSSEAERVREYLDSRYTLQDVRYTFRTASNQTVDCIDFFAQRSVREDAKRGIVLTDLPTPPPVPTEFTRSPKAFASDPGSDQDGNRRVCPAGSVPTPRITPADIEARGGLDAFLGSRRRKHPPVPSPRPQPRPLDAPPSSPPGNGGACTQFAQGDLSSPSEGAYAHVQQSVYPGASGSADIVKGGGTFSIYAPGLPHADNHSLMQIWMFSGWGFDGFGCACGGTTGIPCVETVETGWDVDPANLGGVNGPVFFTFSTWNGYQSDNPGCYDGCDVGGDQWHGFGGTLFPGYPLPSSVPGYAPQYELPVVVGWDGYGDVYTDDGYSAITLARSEYSDVSAWSSASVYAVSTGGDIYQGTNTGTWTSTGLSGSQVAFDTIAWQYDSNPWLLDASGLVYEPPSYSALTTHICGGGTMNPLIQIAVKNSVVFGLGEKGTVWYYTLANNCWKQVGAKFEFANSIATDSGNTTSVWASDADGNIWTAE